MLLKLALILTCLSTSACAALLPNYAVTLSGHRIDEQSEQSKMSPMPLRCLFVNCDGAHES